METSLLVIDSELKGLLSRFSKYHPEAPKEGLKLVLKLYLKLMDKSKRRGADPLLVMQNLIERITTGRLYETPQDRVKHLDLLLEGKVDQKSSYETTPLFEQLVEMKNMLREIRSLREPETSMSGRLSPKEAAKLLGINKEGAGDGKRANYKEIRKERQNKKINF